MTDYTVKDPWSTIMKEALARFFVCNIVGHARPRAFDGGRKACSRCSR